MIDIEKKYNVSRETYKKLENYQTLVLEWNSKFNLISKSTEMNIWERHMVDSLQLIKYISKEDKILLDLGSGAGFPAVFLLEHIPQHFQRLERSSYARLYPAIRCQGLQQGLAMIRSKQQGFRKTINALTARLHQNR